MYYKNHRKMLRGTFDLSIKVLKKLKKEHYECFVLSNWSAETFAGMTDDYPFLKLFDGCLLYTSPSPRDRLLSRMPSSA